MDVTGKNEGNGHNVFKSFFIKAGEIFGGNSDNRKLEISGPINFTHEVHVGFNPSTGDFEGLPEDWKTLLDHSGITLMERIHRPDAVIDVLKLYHEINRKNETYLCQIPEKKIEKKPIPPIPTNLPKEKPYFPPRPAHTLSAFSQVINENIKCQDLPKPSSPVLLPPSRKT
ncbi:PBD-domain-containing protein, partial [Rozella allomycis CSF55]